jgi:hypothetical protein
MLGEFSMTLVVSLNLGGRDTEDDIAGDAVTIAAACDRPLGGSVDPASSMTNNLFANASTSKSGSEIESITCSSPGASPPCRPPAGTLFPSPSTSLSSSKTLGIPLAVVDLDPPIIDPDEEDAELPKVQDDKFGRARRLLVLECLLLEVESGCVPSAIAAFIEDTVAASIEPAADEPATFTSTPAPAPAMPPDHIDRAPTVVGAPLAVPVG